MQLTGKVIETKLKKGTSKSTGKEWHSKQVIVEYQEGTCTRTVAFELFGDNNIDSNPVRKGQIVTVEFNVESREFNGNWYTSCNAWRIMSGTTVADQVQMAQPVDVDLDGDSGLPF